MEVLSAVIASSETGYRFVLGAVGFGSGHGPFLSALSLATGQPHETLTRSSQPSPVCEVQKLCSHEGLGIQNVHAVS